MNKRVACLLALGLAQMLGDVCGVPMLRAAAAATAASPAPKVFTRVGQLEPFSMRFALRVHGAGGEVERIALTPERYAALAGPYNRRNALGAAIAAAPVLVRDPKTAALFHETARYALCGAAPALRELGTRVEVVRRVEIEYRDGRAPDDGRTPGAVLHRMEVTCP